MIGKKCKMNISFRFQKLCLDLYQCNFLKTIFASIHFENVNCHYDIKKSQDRKLPKKEVQKHK